MEMNSFSGATLLVGALIFIIGLLFRLFQPKKINCIYGYRTQSSMRNQKSWTIANKHSANLMIIYGVFLAMAGFTSSFIGRLSTNYAGYSVLLILLMFGLIFYQTEREIKKNSA